MFDGKQLGNEQKKAVFDKESHFLSFLIARQNRKSERKGGRSRDIYISTSHAEITRIFPFSFPKISEQKTVSEDGHSLIIFNDKGGASC